jgi:predicted dehydrogenase
MKQIHVGFIGAGGIAKSHAYAIRALNFFYDNAPIITLESVTSAREESRTLFAGKFKFLSSPPLEEFCKNKNIDAVFILGPNKVHFEHFQMALNMPGVKYIYLEKPVCSSLEEEIKMNKLLVETGDRVKIQVGFQYLQTSSVREALKLWRSGILGKPLHFDLKYYHGDYLNADYRAKRQSRLTPAPDGGAMADLGSHGISLLIAFLGDKLKITGAIQSGSFKDVPADSDLFSSVSVTDCETKAAGHLSASRISSGSGDLVSVDIYAEKGWLSYSSKNPGFFEYYLEDSGQHIKKYTGSDYSPVTAFPSKHASPGWLRSLVHAHYLFFTGSDNESFIPGLDHGLAVQRLVRETADHLSYFRKLRENG